MKNCGRIHSYESFGTLDGPGIRFVLFLQGCPCRCIYCHNPDTWQEDSGILTRTDEIVEKIEKCRNYLERGGVTLSGGEPLLQSEFCVDLLTRLKEAGFHTAIDTSGCIPIAQSFQAIDLADMLLLDIKSHVDDIHKKITGISNKNTIATLEYCEKTNKDVWIRHVLIPAITLVDEHVAGLAKFLNRFSCIKRTDLLPFHKGGEYKWEKLNMKSPLADTAEPTKSEVELANKIYTDC